MRIDKYLHSIRYFKTRGLASHACKNNCVKMEDNFIKTSKEVQIGDKLSVKKDAIWYSIKVIGIPKGRVGAKDVGLYAMDTTPQKLIDEMKQRAKDQNYYREKREGRPTKKDRRSIDDFFDETPD